MMAHRQRKKFGTDRRRRHHHWNVTIYYPDGERFARRYTNRKKAEGFAERQKKSPIVKRVRITQVS